MIFLLQRDGNSISVNTVSFILELVILHPRTEAEEYKTTNQKFQSHVPSSGISFQDVHVSPLTGFHSMSEDKKKEIQGPKFDTKTMRRTITAINGKSVELSCSVIDLGNKTVRTQVLNFLFLSNSF